MSELPVVIKGKQYRVSQVGIGAVHKEVRTQIIRGWADNLRTFISGLDDSPESLQLVDQMRSDASAMLRRGVSNSDINDWIYSLEGIHYVFWMSIRDNHPDTTLIECSEICQNLDAEDFEAIRDAVQHAQGVVINPSSPAETPETPET